MAANNLTVEQIYTIVNALQSAALGKDATVQAVDAKSFVTVGQTLLKCSNDTILNAISQVLTGTIYSVNPYTRKFGGIKVDAARFGNITRKLNIADGVFESGEFDLAPDGTAVDQYKVKRPNVLQLNFYGQNNFVLQHPSIFRNQLNIAFSSPEELARFWSMVTQNANDMIEQAHENLARNTVSAFIASKIQGDSDNVIHLVTEYNAETGKNLEPGVAAANDPDFVKWSYARINSLSDLMTERSILFHQNVTGKAIARHTSKERQKMYMYAPFLNKVKTMTLSGAINEGDIAIGDVERVNYWQDIKAPMTIKQTIQPLKADGTLDTAATITETNLLGVLFDEDALGYTTVDNYVLSTPMNAAGAYTNMFYHFTDKYWIDLTENGLVFILD